MLRRNQTVLVLLVFLLLSQIGRAQVGIVENFNFNWKFYYGDLKNAEQPDFNDNTWSLVDLPHDFQIEQPWVTPNLWGEGTDKKNLSLSKNIKARGFKPMSSGWYRKSFIPVQNWKGQQVILDFGGILLVGDVWLNGKKIGKTDYGYSGFEIDISSDLKWDETNVLAVRANTGSYSASRWYTGGGIYRDVNILIKNSKLSFARHGIYITTPIINKNSAKIKVQSEIENKTGKSLNISVGVRIFNQEEKEISKIITNLDIDSRNKSGEYPLNELDVSMPQLWSCESPNLYTAEVTLFDENNQVVDRVIEKFGIRTIEYSPKFGFKLNGKKVLLKGIANHHELGALGAAAYDRAIEKRFQLFKSFGINHIRCSHNQYSKEFYDLADKYGILIIDEAFDKWNKQYAGGRSDWWSLWPQVISELVKSDRNHPSVIMWSLGNELQVNESWTGYPKSNDWGVTAYRIQNTLVKRYDNTRPTTVAMFPRRRYSASNLPPELAVATEIASFNYTYKDFRHDSKIYPDMIFYQSEASVNDMGPNFYGMALDSVVGLAYWGLIDYLGESRDLAYKGWKQGVFKIDLQPKPQAYLLKSMFSDDPVIHIGIVEQEGDTLAWNDVKMGTATMNDYWNYADGSVLNMFTYTNANEVELIINGKSIGKKINELNNPQKRNRIYWENIPYKKGNIVAVAYKNGKEVCRHKIETTGKAIKLVIEPDSLPWLANGEDIKHLRIYAVDSKGRRVPEANEMLTFDVTGDARIVAVDNGDLTSDEIHTVNKRSLYQGAALVIIRSGKTAGNITLKVSCQSYKPVKINIKTS